LAQGPEEKQGFLGTRVGFILSFPFLVLLSLREIRNFPATGEHTTIAIPRRLNSTLSYTILFNLFKPRKLLNL
jgi:hypothetical protein